MMLGLSFIAPSPTLPAASELYHPVLLWPTAKGCEEEPLALMTKAGVNRES